MSLFYKKTAKKNPMSPESPKKWYILLKSTGQVGEKEVAKLLADETTLNPKEAEMALAQFQKIMSRLLLDGKTVTIGDWGSFYLTASSYPAVSEAEAKASLLKNLNIRFNPGKEMKEQINREARLVDINTLTSDSKKPTE